jgi:hypothetical protein
MLKVIINISSQIIMAEKFFTRLGQLGLGMMFGGVVLTRFFFVVDGGERAVIFNKIRGV